MNIAIVTTWHEGGAGYVSRAYMQVLQTDGHNVFIYARGGRYYPVGDPIWDLPNVTWGLRYMPLNRISQFNQQYVNMRHFEKWLLHNQIDIIITNEDTRNDLARRAKKIGYIVGTYIDYYKKSTVTQFKVYDFLLCNTKRHYSVFCKFKNAFYLPWGTDISMFKPQVKAQHQLQEKQALVFFHSANFGGRNCRKGTDLLLKAFQNVKGNVRLIIHSQAPLEKFGGAAAEIIRLDDRIEFIKKTVPAPGLYHLGDVFVYPSRLEGIGLCVAEALACRLPVITTNNAPMNEFVKDKYNGLLVQVQQLRNREDNYYWPESIVDIKDLTIKMQYYVEHPEILKIHKENARQSAETNLNWMKNASSLGNALEKLIAGEDRQPRQSKTYERFVWWLEAKYVSFLSLARTIIRKLFKRKTP